MVHFAARVILRATLPLLILVCGCAGVARQPVNDLAPAVRQAALQQIEHFIVSGKLGIWSEDQALSSRFTWSQSGDAISVTLSAPLGLGQWRLSDSPVSGAALQRGTEPAWRDTSLDRLVQRALALDTPVPVSQLGFWLKGSVGEGLAPQFDDFGRLESLRYVDSAEGRWQMRVLRYRHADAQEVPALIVANGTATVADGSRETYRLRLVLDEWRASDSTSGLNGALPGAAEPPASRSKRLPIPGR